MQQTHLISYVVGAISVAVALICSLVLRTLIEPNYFLLFVAAVAFSAWLRGLRAGLLATALSAVFVGYFFEESFSDSLVHLTIFLVIALSINWLMASRAETLKSFHRSELELTAFINTASVAMHWTDDKGRIVWANAAELDMLGYSREEFVGCPIADFFVDKTAALDILRRLKAHETLKNFETQIRCKAGGVKDVLMDANVLWEEGKFIHSSFFLRDITEHKRMEQDLREREEHYRSLVDTSPDAIILTDLGARILLCNQQAARVHGFVGPEDMIAKSAYDLIAPEDRARAIESADKALETGSIRNVQFTLLRANGTHFPGEINASLIRDAEGKPKGFIGLIRDITERKEAEEALRRYAHELESRNRELDAYGHTIAHDLKAPLSLMIGYANLIGATESPLSDEDRDYAAKIQENGQRLVRMIDQLLELAILRDAAQTLTEVNVNEAVTSVLERFRGELENKQIAVEFASHLPDALGHAPWVEEIFANLIGNAIKYMGQDNPAPRITIRGYLVDSQMVRYEIRDNGVGIDPKDHARLFDMFSRLHTVDTPGSGLGLSIVHRLVHKLGGHVGVESMLGQGSTFWFTLRTTTVPMITPEQKLL